MQSGSSDLDALGTMIDEGEKAHEILGLPRNASGAEVREAYIKLVKQYHPDTHPGDLTAERRVKRITTAYNELRSSYRFVGSHAHRAPEFWGSYRQVLAIAVLFFVLTPSAIFFVMRSVNWSVPSLELGQAERVPSGTGDGGGSGPVKETAIERALAPSAPRGRTAALKIDGFMPGTPLPHNSGAAEAPLTEQKRSFDVSIEGTSVASLSEGFAKEARFPGSETPEAHPAQGADEAHSLPDDTPPGQARIPDFQAPSPYNEIATALPDDTFRPADQNNQKKVASVQPRIQHKREAEVEPQAPPHRDKTAVERTGKKSIVPSKTVDIAAISIPGKKLSSTPGLPAQSARAALLEHPLDRTVLTAAPGG